MARKRKTTKRTYRKRGRGVRKAPKRIGSRGRRKPVLVRRIPTIAAITGAIKRSRGRGWADKKPARAAVIHTPVRAVPVPRIAAAPKKGSWGKTALKGLAGLAALAGAAYAGKQAYDSPIRRMARKHTSLPSFGQSTISTYKDYIPVI